MVTFTCRVTESGSLAWLAKPFINQSDPVIFSGVSSEGETRDPTAQIHIILDDVSPGSDPHLRNFISTLTLTDSTALNGTEIQCGNVLLNSAQVLTIGSEFMHDMSIPNKMFASIKG